MNQRPPGFWSVPATDLLEQLGATPRGLTSAEAGQRLTRLGSNLLTPKRRTDELALVLAQFKSPLILILLIAAGLSFFLHDPVDASIILAIVLASGLLGFWQERGAAHALEKLLAIVQTKAVALRDGVEREIPVEEIVPGDVVVLSPGGNLPGDCLILESQDLFVDEATLTGETYPVAKARSDAAARDAPRPADEHALHGNPRGERPRARPWSSARAGPRSSARFPSGSSSGPPKPTSSAASGASAIC